MNDQPLLLLYRGVLGSCNYDCPYCPFAKHRSDAAELEQDEAELERFVGWAQSYDQLRADDGRLPSRLSVLFTPWGEALIRSWYRRALVALSHSSHIHKVAIQTNLSVQTGWLTEADLDRVDLWCSFHPGEVDYDAFLERCLALREMGAGFSVGVVGLKEHLPSAERLREDLPADVYLWINAYRHQGLDYYSPLDIAAFRRLDPLFELNLRPHPSRGKLCHAGSKALSVAGDGTLKRCHFIPEPIGNLYTDSLGDVLRPRLCSAGACGCHIGYVHLDALDLYRTFGDGLAARIPSQIPPTATTIHSSNRLQP